MLLDERVVVGREGVNHKQSFNRDGYHLAFIESSGSANTWFVLSCSPEASPV